MLPERKTGGYRIRPYDIIDILYTNAAAGTVIRCGVRKKEYARGNFFQKSSPSRTPSKNF